MYVLLVIALISKKKYLNEKIMYIEYINIFYKMYLIDSKKHHLLNNIKILKNNYVTVLIICRLFKNIFRVSKFYKRVIKRYISIYKLPNYSKINMSNCNDMYHQICEYFLIGKWFLIQNKRAGLIFKRSIVTFYKLISIRADYDTKTWQNVENNKLDKTPKYNSLLNNDQYSLNASVYRHLPLVHFTKMQHLFQFNIISHKKNIALSHRTFRYFAQIITIFGQELFDRSLSLSRITVVDIKSRLRDCLNSYIVNFRSINTANCNSYYTICEPLFTTKKNKVQKNARLALLFESSSLLRSLIIRSTLSYKTHCELHLLRFLHILNYLKINKNIYIQFIHFEMENVINLKSKKKHLLLLLKCIILIKHIKRATTSQHLDFILVCMYKMLKSFKIF